MSYKISTKTEQGWRTVGNFKQNKWGKMSLGLRKTPDLIALFNNTTEGSWMNLSAFEEEPKEVERQVDDVAEAIEGFGDHGAPF